jgi:hypothetical protein
VHVDVLGDMVMVRLPGLAGLIIRVVIVRVRLV